MKLSHRLSQRLLITPQLKQALYLLQLPYPALFNYINQEISENPLLQAANQEDLDTKIKQCLSTNSQTKFTKQISSNFSGEQEFTAKNMKSNDLGLHEYLLHQLGMTFLSKKELSIAYELINYIDSNGYLRIDLDKFTKEHNLSLDKTAAVLKTIQELEPSGVGARNLQECVLIQLKNKEREDSIAYKIVQSYFKELSRKKYDVIAKKLNISIDEVEKAIKEILSLNPRPGTVISCEENVAIKPDICVKKIHKNKLRVIFNDSDLPKLRINSEHKKLLKDSDTPTEVKQFIKERLKSALWLIKAIEQREKNSLKVFRAIVDIQKQAICKDLSYVKPLSLKDIAEKTGLHLSTVGRIVSNKYIATPEGTIKAKDLFSSKLGLGKNGEISNKSILAKIKNLILAEDKQKPLTDQAISMILGDESVKISRRTIAKYRAKLKIPPSFLR